MLIDEKDIHIKYQRWSSWIGYSTFQTNDPGSTPGLGLFLILLNSLRLWNRYDDILLATSDYGERGVNLWERYILNIRGGLVG